MKKITLSLMAFCLFGFANAQLSGLNVGDVAPNFTLTDLDGNVHQKSDYAGQYLLIDMFFTTCGPCQGVSPIINQFYVKYGCNQFDIQVLAVETTTDNAATHAYEASYGGDQAHLTTTCSGTEGGGTTFQSAYNAQAFPTIIIIGPDGLLKNIDLWPVSSLADLEAGMTAAGATLTPHSCASGISELALVDTKLFPNPSTGAITFEFESNNSDALTINVVDIVGHNLHSEKYTSSNGSNSIEFNFAELKSGSYFLNVTNSEGITSSHPFQIK